MITDSAPNMAHSASVLSVHSKPTETPLTKELVLKNYSDIFQGLGKFPGEPYKLKLNQTPHQPSTDPERYLYICKMHSMKKSKG